jgi:hypothetical protein
MGKRDDGGSKTVDALIAAAEQAAAAEPDLVDGVATAIKLTAEQGADPYLLTGALIEGVASVIATWVPLERQRDVSIAAVQLLWDRLREWGAV